MAYPRILVGEFKLNIPGGEVYRKTLTMYDPTGIETFAVRCMKHPNWHQVFKANVWAAADLEGAIADAAFAALQLCPECVDARLYKNTRFPEGAEL